MASADLTKQEGSTDKVQFIRASEPDRCARVARENLILRIGRQDIMRPRHQTPYCDIPLGATAAITLQTAET
jgi:hypothetical protein